MLSIFRELSKKNIIVIAALTAILLASVGGVFAFLVSRPAPVTNEFTPASVTCAVEETFEGGTDRDVKIRNTGNVNAYIRAMVIFTFEDGDGKVLAVSPKEGTDYTVVWAESGWLKGADGFWYHVSAVAPNGTTSDLIESASLIGAPDGFDLNIQVIATAIQSDPTTAVEQAWDVTVSNGIVIPER